MTPLDLFLYVLAVCFGVPFALMLAVIAIAALVVGGGFALATISVKLDERDQRKRLARRAKARDGDGWR